jgi:formate dehydrogenase subunit gamma
MADRAVNTASAPSVLVHRFSAADRVVHWTIAACILALLATGLSLGQFMPNSINPVIAHRDVVRSVHLDASVILIMIVVLALGRGAPLNALWHDVEMFTRDDWAWLRRIAVPARWRREPLPPQGRFNAGQKLNTVLTAAAVVGFVATGGLMWQGGHLASSLSSAASQWHDWLTFLIIPLIAGHIAVALLFRSTRPAMRGMLLGAVRLDFARRRHARWADEVAPIMAADSRQESTSG